MTLLQVVHRGWDALVHPKVRLNADFPLTGKRMGEAYVKATGIFFGFSFLPMAIFVVGVVLGAVYLPQEKVKQMMSLLFLPSGMLTMNAMVALCSISFCMGFGAEMIFWKRHLKTQGYKLREVIGFSLKPLWKGSWLKTGWAVIWRVAVAYAIWFCFEHAIGPYLPEGAEQPTVTLARKLSGGNFWVFLAMATLGAGFLEETVFRGILFQWLRTTFRLKEPESGVADHTRLISITAFVAGMCLPLTALAYRLMAGLSVDVPMGWKPALIMTLIGMCEGLVFQAWYVSRSAARQKIADVSLSQYLLGKLKPGKAVMAVLGRVMWMLLLFGSLTLGPLVGRELYDGQGGAIIDSYLHNHVFCWAIAVLPLVVLAIAELMMSGLPFKFGQWIYAKILRFTSKSETRADVTAILVSGAIFSLEHLQFQPATLLMLMLMGCFLAELYRRTGTLWCGILLHAINNGIAVWMLANSGH
jgi:membrane protease YdiL (CAAX protease family)